MNVSIAVQEAEPRSLVERAYQQLVVLITRLELSPGEIINERQLIADLGIGRTPMREALRQLAGEGLITHLPNRGMFVADINATTVKHIYEFRSLVEMEAARLAALRASQINISDLKTVCSRMLDAAAASDVDLYAELDRAFYSTLAAAAQNVFLRDAIMGIFNHHLRLWFYIASKFGGWKEIMSAHAVMVQGVVEGISARDPDKASKALENYIRERHKDAMSFI